MQFTSPIRTMSRDTFIEIIDEAVRWANVPTEGRWALEQIARKARFTAVGSYAYGCPLVAAGLLTVTGADTLFGARLREFTRFGFVGEFVYRFDERMLTALGETATGALTVEIV